MYCALCFLWNHDVLKIQTCMDFDSNMDQCFVQKTKALRFIQKFTA